MRTSLASRALIALLLALSLVAASCGGSDDEQTGADIVADALSDDDAPDDSDSSASDTESSDTTEDEPEEEPPADEPDEADEPEEADEPVATSGNAAAFCAKYAENEALFDELDFFDPDQVETWINTSQGLLAEAIGDAPGELVPDLQTIQTSFAELASVLESFGYDFFAASDAVDEASESPEADAASDRLDAWIDANCPEVASDESAGDSLDDFTTPEALEGILGSEAGRELFIDGMTEGTGVTRDQAECMIENLDAEMLSALATNPDAIGTDGALDLLDVLTACGIDIGALTG